MYLTISGGAYGLEDAVRIAGPRLTILLCLVVPLSLSAPTALMAAELTALMPREGGFYFWVKDALGKFAGFAEAYLTILYTAVDMAIYPVLFVSYISFVIHLSANAQVVAAVAIVWAAGCLNMMGVRPVGRASILFTVLLLVPFVAMVVVGLPRLIHLDIPTAHLDPSAGFVQILGGGLTVIIWNFGGWENLSVVAGELEAPRRNYLRAVAVVLPLVVIGYLLPLAVGVSGAPAAEQWHLGSFAEVGRRLGGPMLGTALALGGIVSSFSVFEAGMLWVSRMPFVLAAEGYLPETLAELSNVSAVPAKAIVACCVVFTALVPLGFTALVVMDVFFYMTALALEMAALLMLRRLRPDREGLFMIRGGKPVLYLIIAAPLLTWVATFGLAFAGAGGEFDFYVAIALALASWPVYWFCKWKFGGPATTETA
jgi:amino acid transporter